MADEAGAGGETQPGEQQQQEAAPGTQQGQTTGAEGNPAEGQKTEGQVAEGEQGGEKEQAAEVVYEFKLPEGVQMDQARHDEFVTVAKELKLPQDAAQKLVDLAAKAEQARVDEHKALVDGWTKQAKEHKELGGEKLPESLATAKKVYDLLPEARANELRTLLNSTGLEAHPVMFELFHAVGSKLSEAAFVRGAAPAGQGESLAQRMYPTMKP